MTTSEREKTEPRGVDSVQIDAEVEQEDNFVYYYNTKEWNPKSGSFPEEEEVPRAAGDFFPLGITFFDAKVCPLASLRPPLS